MILTGRTIYSGEAVGEALVTSQGISFFGGVDPDTGRIVERGHELEGWCIAGKVLVFPTGKGSGGSVFIPRVQRPLMWASAAMSCPLEASFSYTAWMEAMSAAPLPMRTMRIMENSGHRL